MEINIIAAKSLNNVIGINNHLPWDLPSEWDFFLQKTKGKHVIVGRVTFEELQKQKIPDDNFWRFIVLSRNPNYKSTKENCLILSDFKIALSYCKKQFCSDLYIIGGQEIYEQAISLANNLFLNIILKDFEGDKFFPKLTQEWSMTKSTKKKLNGLSVNLTEWKRRT